MILLKRGFKGLWPLCSTLNLWIGEFVISFYDVTKRLQDENYRKLITKIITTNEQELMEV